MQQNRAAWQSRGGQPLTPLPVREDEWVGDEPKRGLLLCNGQSRVP